MPAAGTVVGIGQRFQNEHFQMRKGRLGALCPGDLENYWLFGGADFID